MNNSSDSDDEDDCNIYNNRNDSDNITRSSKHYSL